MTILITGGAGYIGSTVCSALEDAGISFVVLDSLVEGRLSFVEGRNFYKGDICDKDLLSRIFSEHPDIDAVIHMASLVVVSESVANPYMYYRENVSKTIEFVNNAYSLGVRKFIFSSSASIYDTSNSIDVGENDSLKPLSPYASTKMYIENIIKDFCASSELRCISLRYFNPIGADPKLRSGPYKKNATHIFGRMADVYKGKSKFFSITGTQYPTRDGTGIRDYIHIWDVAQAHVSCYQRFNKVFDEMNHKYAYREKSIAINIGTGQGYTVRELISSFEKALNCRLPIVEVSERPGDSVGAFARIDRAVELLEWKPLHTIEEAIIDGIRWEKVFSKAHES